MKSTLKAILIIAGILILVFVVANEALRVHYDKEETVVAVNWQNSDSSRDAYYISQDFIKDILKVPASAKFPMYRDISVEKEGNRYHVTAYVESQNSYGVQARTYYTMTLEQLSSNQFKMVNYATR